jgi:hypothetical protein
MRQITSIIFFCFNSFIVFGQLAAVKQINEVNTPAVALAPLRFLASDELMGRGTTRPEIHVAARYISETFRGFGLKEVAGTIDYFQRFEIKLQTPAATGSFKVTGNNYTVDNSLLALRGGDCNITAPVIFAKHGTEKDLESLDVKGKIVITEFGETDSTATKQSFNFLFGKKQPLLQQKGAVAIIERFRPAGVSWDDLKKSNSRETVVVNEITIPVLIVNDSAAVLNNLKEGDHAILTINGSLTRTVAAKNVMGWVEGTDPKLKNEYIVLSSHYDHLGVAQQPKFDDGRPDSIYNGARDNAIGTAAVINAARYFAKYPSRRSILFIAFTGEEMGLIGSRYFAEHPPLPLKQLVYDLNNDNASYNDTTAITFVALGRTTADNDIKKACTAYGLSVLPDPTSGKLFTGSDNLPLAEKGIPAPTFSLGMKKFDQTIFSRYHQLSDEVGNFDLVYAMKFINSFILAARYIADNPAKPGWTKGDQYEQAWQNLYFNK